jgi:hypothetical protein
LDDSSDLPSLEPVFDGKLFVVESGEFISDQPVAFLPVKVLQIREGDPQTADAVYHNLDDKRGQVAEFSLQPGKQLLYGVSVVSPAGHELFP